MTSHPDAHHRDALHTGELARLGALAETLLPADDTPGADADWASAFLARHLARHPHELPRFRALAAHVDSLARAARGTAFESLAVAEREAVLRARHPSLADDAELAADERALRGAMRDLLVGFLTADALDLRDDPYHRLGARRAREEASPPTHSAADFVPDVVHDRMMATWVGTGTYARVWRAAGYRPPGLPPEEPEDLARSPEELVRLRRR